MSGKAPKFASERAMAEAVVSWLRADGWSTFHEVECRGGRADIVAVCQLDELDRHLLTSREGSL